MSCAKTKTVPAASNGAASTLGQPVPPFTSHAISVSLPTWRDNVGYEEGEKRVSDAMETGYPRFFIHKSIQKLASICENKFGRDDERCLLFPSKTVAELCRAFMIRRSSLEGAPVPVRIVEFPLHRRHPLLSNGTNGITLNGTKGVSPPSTPAPSRAILDLHAVFFPAASFPLAKQFWQHTGLGVSSRFAERCLSLLPSSVSSNGIDASSSVPASPALSRPPTARNRHYSVKDPFALAATAPKSPPPKPAAPATADAEEDLSADQATYLEERYGRNLPQCSAAAAKRALRRRIAGVLVNDVCSTPASPSSRSLASSPEPPELPIAGSERAELGPSSRGIEAVSERDVFLYPTGMSAIWAAHQLALRSRPEAKSVCFGFPYTDTLKILQKWGPGCHFFGHGLDSDIDELERVLAEESSKADEEGRPPILALFSEFPSNPLLRSPNLPRLRALADRYDFLIVIDETIGNFVNVSVLPYADIVVSSLTKVFSGDSNVMGGSLILNPAGRHYDSLRETLAERYEDTYFGEDAIFMERNSRNFIKRVKVINDNAEAVCDFLRSRSVAAADSTRSERSQVHSNGPVNVNGHATAPSPPRRVIKEVFYPKYTTRANYDLCRNAALPPDESNFGGLFSVTFTATAASEAFFDALACHKGPSLGTSFTLACPYTILAHYGELAWAGGYGVEAGLVRVSVGTEERAELLRCFEEAVKEAAAAAAE